MGSVQTEPYCIHSTVNNVNCLLLSLVPPSSISMPGRIAGQVIDINVNEELELTCLVSNSKPVSSIQWYRNDIPLSVADKEEETLSGDDVAAFRGQDRQSIRSKIKFRPSSADNGATYACEAKHDALAGRPRMRFAVVLSVHCKFVSSHPTGCFKS